MMSFRIFLILSIFCSGIIFGGEVYAFNKKPKKNLYKKGLDFYDQGNYTDAKKALSQHVKTYSDDFTAIYYLGLCQLLLDEYEAALKTFQKSADLDKEGGFELIDMYYLAYLNHITHRFDEAISKYNLLSINMHRLGLEAITLPDFSEDIELAAIRNKIRQCEYAKKQVANPIEVEIRVLSSNINSKWPEFAPIISSDQNSLVFTSRRPEGVGSRSDDGLFYEDVFISNRQANGKWGKATLLDTGLVNTAEHDASVALSNSGKELIIYRSTQDFISNFTQTPSGNLYYSIRMDGKWEIPVPFPEPINTKHWEASASLTADGKTIFFSSDRPGGLGGVDIYSANLSSSGNWTQIQNLGNTINSELDEDAPYINADGSVLHFASKGHDNMGGFDIFTSKYNKEYGAWSEAENMGYPINTSADEVHFAWTQDGSTGYFASARADSRGSTDIYTVSLLETRFHFITVTGKVYDKETKEPVKANLKIYDNEKQEEVETKFVNANGEYSLTLKPGNYSVHFLKSGYLFASENVYYPAGFQSLQEEKDIYLAKADNGNGSDLNNLFFEDDVYRAKLSSQELVTLKQLAARYPERKLKLKLIYSCLAKDEDRYMKVLQENKQAIEASLNNIDVIADNIEVVPIVITEQDESIFLEPARLSKYSIHDKTVDLELIEQEEILLSQEEADTMAKLIDVKELDKQVVQEGDILIEEVIHFDRNVGGRIDKEFLVVLGKVRFFISKYPTMKVEVAGYTDSHGSHSYNLKLSRQRAKFIREQLIRRGIKGERLIVKAHGEEEPIATNDTEEGRRLNRRVEFRVASMK